MSKKVSYYLHYVIIKAVVAFLSIFSFDIRCNIGSFLFSSLLCFTKLNRTAIKNLAFIYPNKTYSEIKNIAKLMWKNFGASFAEFPFIYKISNKCYKKHVTFIGAEKLDSLKDGGILFSAHYGNWEVVPRYLLEKKMKISIVYRKANNPLTEKMIQKYRNYPEISFIAKGKSGRRSLLKAIREKHVIVMLVDQKMHQGIKMKFLDHDAYIATGVATMALDYNLPLIPVKTRRNANNVTEVTFFDNVVIKKSGNKEQDIFDILSNVNYILESWILEDPTQWMWFHNKWN
jgi:Kdo2-lipid IVA lauroyltransferase/acyltransferase